VPIIVVGVLISIAGGLPWPGKLRPDIGLLASAVDGLVTRILD